MVERIVQQWERFPNGGGSCWRRIIDVVGACHLVAFAWFEDDGFRLRCLIRLDEEGRIFCVVKSEARISRTGRFSELLLWSEKIISELEASYAQ